MTDLRTQIRALTPEALHMHGILQKSLDGNYVCPFCGNGSGDDGTGIEFTPTDDGTFVSKCFKCQKGMDIIDVLSEHYHKAIGAELFEEVGKEFKLEGKEEEAERKDYTEKIEAARKELYGFCQECEEKGKYRGLRYETLEQFHCGFAPKHWSYDKHSGKYYRVPRFIIPTSKYHYLGRLTIAKEDLSKYGAPASTAEKQHWGTKEIFNFVALKNATAEDIFFCVEGEFDAMSIVQAGFKAFALSGSEIGDPRGKFGQKDQLKSVAKKPKVIVLFDNDTTGEAHSADVMKQLRKLGYKTQRAFLPKTVTKADNEVVAVKDANELLQVDEKLLSKALNDIIHKCSDKFQEWTSRDDFIREERKVIITSRQVFPDCPVDVAIPAEFFVRREGVFKFFKTPGHETELVCSAPVFIGKRFSLPR